MRLSRGPGRVRDSRIRQAARALSLKRVCPLAWPTRPGRFPADKADRNASDGCLRQRVAAGLVHDRAGVLAAFEETSYEVPRQGKNYLTVAHPQTG